jgi:hypothetical protein
MKHAALLAFFALFLLSAPARAAEDDGVVGTVQEIEGLATVNGAAAVVDAPVHAHDILSTGAGSRLFVLLIDDTELTLSENAKMSVDEYVFDDKDASSNKARYSILQGAFLYVSGLIAHKENPDVEIETPVGAIGIRGTKFWGGDIDDGYGVLVTEGKVNLRTAGGAQEIGPGLGVHIKDRAAPVETPHTWGEGRTKRAVATVFLKRQELVQKRIALMKARHDRMRARYSRWLEKHRAGGGQGVRPDGQRRGLFRHRKKAD